MESLAETTSFKEEEKKKTFDRTKCRFGSAVEMQSPLDF